MMIAAALMAAIMVLALTPLSFGLLGWDKRGQINVNVTRVTPIEEGLIHARPRISRPRSH
ncbi:hypothetical protein GCM10020001_040670 [Nonomuraea salmonea]